MSRRRKGKAKRSLLTVLVVLAALVIVVNLGKNYIVKSMIEKTASANLKVPVRIDGFNLTLTSGRITLRGVTIGNPSGFESPHLLHLTEGDVRFDLHTLMDPVLVIDSIRLNGLSVYYEIGVKGTNLGAVINQSAPPDKSAAPPQDKHQKQAAKQGRELIIRDLTMTDVSAIPSLNVAGKKESRTVQIADIYIQDIGREGKTVNVAEASDIILGTVSKNIAIKMPGHLMGQGFEKVGKGIKNLFGN